MTLYKRDFKAWRPALLTGSSFLHLVWLEEGLFSITEKFHATFSIDQSASVLSSFLPVRLTNRAKRSTDEVHTWCRYWLINIQITNRSDWKKQTPSKIKTLSPCSDHFRIWWAVTIDVDVELHRLVCRSWYATCIRFRIVRSIERVNQSKHSHGRFSLGSVRLVDVKAHGPICIGAVKRFSFFLRDSFPIDRGSDLARIYAA
jgi:hypothetical protein